MFSHWWLWLIMELAFSLLYYAEMLYEQVPQCLWVALPECSLFLWYAQGGNDGKLLVSTIIQFGSSVASIKRCYVSRLETNSFLIVCWWQCGNVLYYCHFSLFLWSAQGGNDGKLLVSTTSATQSCLRGSWKYSHRLFSLNSGRKGKNDSQSDVDRAHQSYSVNLWSAHTSNTGYSTVSSGE